MQAEDLKHCFQECLAASCVDLDLQFISLVDWTYILRQNLNLAFQLRLFTEFAQTHLFVVQEKVRYSVWILTCCVQSFDRRKRVIFCQS